MLSHVVFRLQFARRTTRTRRALVLGAGQNADAASTEQELIQLITETTHQLKEWNQGKSIFVVSNDDALFIGEYVPVVSRFLGTTERVVCVRDKG